MILYNFKEMRLFFSQSQEDSKSNEGKEYLFSILFVLIQNNKYNAMSWLTLVNISPSVAHIVLLIIFKL